ncbi:MAG: SRPBCC family protein [Actinobacteria bacterium]|nr:SRPBCC family protein [Actinomycetota bacterium]
MSTPKSERHVSTSRVIAATPQKIFEVLADPARHPIIDGSGTLVGAKDNSPRLSLGAKFGMRMSFHATMRNKVLEFDEGKRIAWRHIGQHVWRYELEPVDGGTKVTETFDWRPSPLAWLLENQDTPTKNLASMEKTLARLDTYVTTGNVPES